MDQETIIWRGVYHLEGCVSSGGGGYGLEKESIIWRGVYHLEMWGRGIIWSRSRVVT
jgi:hypothetical protein